MLGSRLLVTMMMTRMGRRTTTTRMTMGRGRRSEWALRSFSLALSRRYTHNTHAGCVMDLWRPLFSALRYYCLFLFLMHDSEAFCRFWILFGLGTWRG